MMSWTTRVNSGGSITVNGVRMTFDRCTSITLHDQASSIVIEKPDGRVFNPLESAMQAEAKP